MPNPCPYVGKALNKITHLKLFSSVKLKYLFLVNGEKRTFHLNALKLELNELLTSSRAYNNINIKRANVYR